MMVITMDSYALQTPPRMADAKPLMQKSIMTFNDLNRLVLFKIVQPTNQYN